MIIGYVYRSLYFSGRKLFSIDRPSVWQVMGPLMVYYKTAATIEVREE